MNSSTESYNTEEQEEPKPKKENIFELLFKIDNWKKFLVHIAIMVIFIMVVIHIVFNVYLPSYTNHGETMTVPDLNGMSIKELDEYLTSRELRYTVNDSNFTLHAKPQTVIAQYPKAGSKVKEGRKLYLTINPVVPPLQDVPNLIDRSLKAAEMMLLSYNLRLGEVTYKPDIVPTVLEMTHEGKPITENDSIPQGSEIDLVVGNGLGNVETNVPNYIGDFLDDAVIAIKGSNYAFTLHPEISKSEYGLYKVTKQRPDPDDPNVSIKEGQIIDLWVEPLLPDSLDTD